MNKQQGCYPEESIVDLVLNKASADKQLAFREHCNQCHTCQALADQWRETLAGYKGHLIDDGDSLQDFYPASDVNSSSSWSDSRNWSAASDWSASRERVKRNIWSKLGHSATAKRLAWLQPKAIAAVCMLAIFLSLASWMKLTLSSPESPPLLASSSLDSQPIIVKQPLAEQLPIDAEQLYYSVSSEIDPLLAGYVTINPATAEVYIYVQGLPTVVGRDYQAWLMEERSPIDMGLLQLDNGAAELYKQTNEVRKANTFRISIEPKGGSVSPTGPDFLFIQLEQ